MDSIILQSSKTCESLSVVPDEAAAARAGFDGAGLRPGQGVDPRPAPGRTHRLGDDLEGIGARTRIRSEIPKKYFSV